MDKIKFGEFLTSERKKRGLNQSDFANLLNVSRQTVGKWENGDALPDLGSFALLCEKLNLNADELLNMEHDVKLTPKDKAINNLVNINKSYKKRNIIMLVLIIILFVLLSIFIIFNVISYNDRKISIYKTASRNEDILANGLMVLTKDIDYLNISIQYLNDKVSDVSLCYLDEAGDMKILAKAQNNYLLSNDSYIENNLENLYISYNLNNDINYMYISLYRDYTNYKNSNTKVSSETLYK